MPLSPFDEPQTYPFDDVFDQSAPTRAIYDKVAYAPLPSDAPRHLYPPITVAAAQVCRDSVRATIDGFNAAICAYGQTSSGKTFTILGKQGSNGSVCPSLLQMWVGRAQS